MITTPEISQDEFKQRRHIFDFCQWIQTKFSEMQENEDFDEIYFERKGQYTKKLIEEALPMSRLGLYFSTPFNDVFVTCFDNNHSPDACIEVKRFIPLFLNVEITTTETKDTTMRRQALARQGSVVFTGPVRRNKKNKREVVVDSEFVNVQVEEQKSIDLMFNRLLAKTENHKFDKKTAILVCHTGFRTISLSNRAVLAKQTHQYLRQKRPNIYGVFYCYLGQNVIDEISDRRPTPR